jgi:hypothetical protein
LGKEASLVGGIDPASPTPVSAVNGQINHIEAQILDVVNHDLTLAKLTAGTDADGNATTGFVPLAPGTEGPNHHDIPPLSLTFGPEMHRFRSEATDQRQEIFHFADANASAKIAWRFAASRKIPAKCAWPSGARLVQLSGAG